MTKREKERTFLIKILERLTRTIKAKVIFFEIVIILFVAFSIGAVLTFYMQRTLTEKAQQFSERISRDLAKSIEQNYISMPASDEAVRSYSGSKGIVYMGYYGIVMSAGKPRKIELSFGVPLEKKYLGHLETTIFKELNGFLPNPETVTVSSNKVLMTAFEYYLPVIVHAGKVTKRIGMIVLRYSKQIIDDDIRNVSNLILVITGIIILISFFISIRGANQIVRPIIRLTEIVQRFSAGDLTVRVDITAKDEIGLLARSFDEMIVSVREKLEMQKFVSDSTVKMIQRSVSQDAPSHDKEKHTEKKIVAMLFSDIRGFTSMSEMLPPAEVVAFLNEYLDVQAGIISKYDGDIDKFVGDAVLALFQGPNMYINSVNAAREIQKTVRELNKKREASGNFAIHLGIGVNAGEVIMGSIGSHDRMDYTVIGDSVNVASRLCSAAKKEEIIISKSIHDRFKENKKVFTKLPAVTVKGKTHPIDVYRVEY
jgi:class 3 adenylate cyclase